MTASSGRPCRRPAGSAREFSRQGLSPARPRAHPAAGCDKTARRPPVLRAPLRAMDRRWRCPAAETAAACRETSAPQAARCRGSRWSPRPEKGAAQDPGDDRVDLGEGGAEPSSVSFGGRPPVRPARRAAARPAGCAPGSGCAQIRLVRQTCEKLAAPVQSSCRELRSGCEARHESRSMLPVSIVGAFPPDGDSPIWSHDRSFTWSRR
jgi:hypothetical protein